MSVTVYDPSENTVDIAGHTLIGLFEIVVDEGNTITKTVEGISPAYSARCKAMLKPFTLRVTLQQTSVSHGYLQQIKNATRRNPATFFAIKVSGTNGTPHLDSIGYLESAPSLTLNEELTDRVYVFKVNPAASTGIVDLIV